MKKLLLTLMIMSFATMTAYASCPVGAPCDDSCGCNVEKQDCACKCKCLDKCKCGCKKKGCEKIEAYAHPTLFPTESQSQIYSVSDYNYVVGGKICKVKNKIGVTNKDQVYISSWSDDVLKMIKDKSQVLDFNPKMPILRSELAVVLAEGFAIDQKASDKQYSDVPYDYWAASWIYKALSSGIMIGYPGNVFKPDQPVTKAEVFATIAQIINVPYTNSGAPMFKGSEIKEIPTWALSATREVAASGLLDNVPDQQKMLSDTYLSKEQVAYLISTLRTQIANNSLAVDSNAPQCVKDYQPIAIHIKMNDRISAKHSNIGDRFTATTTAAVTIDGKEFPCGSEVRGKVVKIQRPGLNRCGLVQVKFISIKNGDCKAFFPEKVSEARAEVLKNPNIIARIVGLPFTGTARVVGVAGRTVGTGVNVIANRAEEFGDNFADIFVETLTLHPGSGLKSAGYSVVTVAKGFVDIGSLLVSGVFGVIYEIGDELVYTIVPSLSNDSALNPNEELVIFF